MKKIALVVGTRPELIKTAPLVRLLEEHRKDYFVIHTGQHYSYELDGVFFKQLGLPAPKYNLGVGSGPHGEQTGKMLAGIEKILVREKPSFVAVQGDTNSTLAGGLAATKLRIPVAHIEAGLRSYDRSTPEETNRVIVDHIGDLLFAPTDLAASHLKAEGIEAAKVSVTGNTVVDVIRKWAPERDSGRKKNKMLLTLHRQENVDVPERLGRILKGLGEAGDRVGMPIVFPAHPRTTSRIEKFGLKTKHIEFMPPVDYLTFIGMERDAALVLTDSGGVQEEACIVGTPCVTLRDATERQETLEIGANVLVGTDPAAIVKGATTMVGKAANWAQPFGDGRASERIEKALS